MPRTPTNGRGGNNRRNRTLSEPADPLASSGLASLSAGNQLAIPNGEIRPWIQLTTEEKTERMRNEVKSLSSRVMSLQRQINKLVTFFEDHTHDKNGDIVFFRKNLEHEIRSESRDLLYCEDSLNSGENSYF